jgi:hypothetical protein
MILLCSMFTGMKIQWQTTWCNKHQVSDQIEETLVFCQNWMFQLVKSDNPVSGQCVV